MIQIVNSHTHSPTNNDVYIGRPSLFGNPFSHQQESKAVIHVETREDAVQAYEDWLLGRDYTDFQQARRARILEALPSLNGKILVCWCAPKLCHGSVLVQLAELSELFVCLS
jgi:hypothetical protein